MAPSILVIENVNGIFSWRLSYCLDSPTIGSFGNVGKGVVTEINNLLFLFHLSPLIGIFICARQQISFIS